MDEWVQKRLHPFPTSNPVTHGNGGPSPHPQLYTDALLSVNKSLPEK